MASERDAAKGAVVKVDSSDPELDDALAKAATHQLALKKEDNRHKEALRKQDLGFFGGWLGGEKSAPTAIASIATCVGLGAALYCLYAASDTVDSSIAGFWSTQSERAFAFATAALAFIFGKGSK